MRDYPINWGNGKSRYSKNLSHGYSKLGSSADTMTDGEISAVNNDRRSRMKLWAGKERIEKLHRHSDGLVRNYPEDETDFRKQKTNRGKKVVKKKPVKRAIRKPTTRKSKK